MSLGPGSLGPGRAATRQLPLPFDHDPRYAPVDFMPAESNEAALAFLAGTADWPGLRLALWGGQGCGKTHLLHRWAAARGARLLSGPCLRPPEAAAGPAATPAGLAVDDADAAPERPLLHLLNAAAEGGVPVLLAAREPPARWGTALPDLASRLRAVLAVGIGPAEDSLLRALLARLLAERQLRVAEEVQDWMLARLPRDPGALREAAARLDRASLAAGGRHFRALAADVVTAIGQVHDVVDRTSAPASPPAPELF